MSSIEKCRECGNLFAFLPRGVCGGCIDRREAAYEAVRDWLRENPGASVRDASEATGVEQSLIASFVREGRLELVAAGAVSAEELRLEQERIERLRRQMVERSTLGTAVATGEFARRSGMRTRGA